MMINQLIKLIHYIVLENVTFFKRLKSANYSEWYHHLPFAAAKGKTQNHFVSPLNITAVHKSVAYPVVLDRPKFLRN
jgi:hypothetical protein